MSQQIAVPESVIALRLLGRVDYQDAFATEVTEERRPEEWMRLALAGSPGSLKALVRRIQMTLGFDLQRPSLEHPLGWSVLRSDSDVCIFGAEGPVGSARLIATTPPGQVVFATQLQFDGARGWLIWPVVAPLHRTVAGLLLRAANREAAR